MRNQGVGRTGNAVAISALHYRWLILAFAIPAVLFLTAGFSPRRLGRRGHEPEPRDRQRNLSSSSTN